MLTQTAEREKKSDFSSLWQKWASMDLSNFHLPKKKNVVKVHCNMHVQCFIKSLILMLVHS